MDRRFLLTTAGLFVALVCHGATVRLLADDAQVPAPAPPAAKPTAGSVPGQESEDRVEPLNPVRPRTAAESARVDALSWFATGRVLQGRGELQGAFNAYKRAVEKDPSVLAIYRQLIPLALHLNQLEDSIRWVQKASQLAPNDFEWLVQLAELQVRSEDLGGRDRQPRTGDQTAGARSQIDSFHRSQESVGAMVFGAAAFERRVARAGTGFRRRSRSAGIQAHSADSQSDSGKPEF
ncbi:MAG: hypothetical protein NT069_31265 [Planctomycetota bacterium]|nr:hypothetical protein [Planctomycetota bacterium]